MKESNSDTGSAKRGVAMTEQELLQDCLRRLGGAGLGYMLVGSMAGNYWGIPRSTHDIDFVIQYQEADVKRIVALFEDDFFIQEISVRSALRPPHQFNAIDERSAFQVDFFRSSDIAGIWSVSGSELDLEHMSHWAKQLGVAQLMDRLERGELIPKTT